MNKENKERLTELLLEHIQTVIEQEKMGKFPNSGLSVSEAANRLIEIWSTKKLYYMEVIVTTVAVIAVIIAIVSVILRVIGRV